MKTAWVWITASVVGVLISLYLSFVVMNYWNWFAVHALNVSNISYLETLGIVWLIGLFTLRSDPNDQKWKMLFAVIQQCVPEHNIEIAKEVVQDQKDNIWKDTFSTVFGQFVGISFSFLLGFVLHVMIK
jgi:hypothetical protein